MLGYSIFYIFTQHYQRELKKENKMIKKRITRKILIIEGKKIYKKISLLTEKLVKIDNTLLNRGIIIEDFEMGKYYNKKLGEK